LFIDAETALAHETHNNPFLELSGTAPKKIKTPPSHFDLFTELYSEKVYLDGTKHFGLRTGQITLKSKHCRDMKKAA
jgi:hypothetical protein